MDRLLQQCKLLEKEGVFRVPCHYSVITLFSWLSGYDAETYLPWGIERYRPTIRWIEDKLLH
jgi:hypothetical protein